MKSLLFTVTDNSAFDNLLMNVDNAHIDRLHSPLSSKSTLLPGPFAEERGVPIYVYVGMITFVHVRAYSNLNTYTYLYIYISICIQINKYIYIYTYL
jgi:hypothetical protein